MEMMGMMDMILMVSFFGGGFYCFYTYYIQSKSKEVLDNKISCPTDCKGKDCLDPEMFIKFIQPKVLIFGIGLLVFGGINLYVYVTKTKDMFINIITVVLPLLLLLWYAMCVYNARKRFWKN